MTNLHVLIKYCIRITKEYEMKEVYYFENIFQIKFFTFRLFAVQEVYR